MDIWYGNLPKDVGMIPHMHMGQGKDFGTQRNAY